MAQWACHRSVATFSGMSNPRSRAHDHGEAQSIAAMIGDAAPCINDASGVKPKAAPGGPERNHFAPILALFQA